MIKTIFDPEFNIETDDYNFYYQESLTTKLDTSNSDFNQEKINEIVLLKYYNALRFISISFLLIQVLPKCLHHIVWLLWLSSVQRWSSVALSIGRFGKQICCRFRTWRVYFAIKELLQCTF